MKILILLLITPLIYSVPQQDVVHLPLVDYNHTWYSGYLTFNTGKYHYVFFESQKDPQKDPLIVWFNGGPGCSSLQGLFYSHGPFTFYQNSHKMHLNQYSWTKQANVIYLQSPGGTGFSHSYRNNTYNDTSATQDNLKALLKFFQKFPNLKKNDFYLTGQSYAGVFVPYLTKSIIEYNKLPSRQMTFNLKGFMINNGCTDTRQCYEPRIVKSNSVYQYQFWYNHGYITQKQYDNMAAICMMGFYTQNCTKIRQDLDDKFAATNSSIYNIYQPCFYQNISSSNPLLSDTGANKLACDDQIGFLDFLNQGTIQSELHVEHQEFKDCNWDVYDKYVKNINQSYPLYPQLIKQKLRIWFVSGDHDADVPITGSLNWIKRLRDQAQLPVQDPWRQWWVKGLHEHQDQVGGMTWGLRGFRFISIKGAGHMAYTDKKKQGYQLIKAFLSGNAPPNKE